MDQNSIDANGKSWICPTFRSIYERYAYLMAPYITPNDNTGFQQRIEQSIMESYRVERDYLHTIINRLECKINILRIEQNELIQWICYHLQSDNNYNYNNRSMMNQGRKYSKRQKKNC